MFYLLKKSKPPISLKDKKSGLEEKLKRQIIILFYSSKTFFGHLLKRKCVIFCKSRAIFCRAARTGCPARVSWIRAVQGAFPQWRSAAGELTPRRPAGTLLRGLRGLAFRTIQDPRVRRAASESRNPVGRNGREAQGQVL